MFTKLLKKSSPRPTFEFGILTSTPSSHTLSTAGSPSGPRSSKSTVSQGVRVNSSSARMYRSCTSLISRCTFPRTVAGMGIRKAYWPASSSGGYTEVSISSRARQ